MTAHTFRAFFEGYAAASMGGDTQAVADHYASTFIVSGREGSASFQNDKDLLDWLNSVLERNREVGMQSLEVSSLRDTPLGDHHALVTVQWATTFEKTGDERIRFAISYLLRLTEKGPLILAYVSHEEEQELMKAKGLV